MLIKKSIIQHLLTFKIDPGRQTGLMKSEKVTLLVSTIAMSKYAVSPSYLG
jgi:hypothetical protein